MASVKRNQRQKKPARHETTTLILKPAHIVDAQTLVSCLDRIDWQRVHESECDTVDIKFQSAEAVKTAYRILLEISAVEPGIRNELVGKINSSFKKNGFPLDPNQATKVNPRLNSINQILKAITSTSNPSRFAEQCIEAARVYNEISAELWKKHKQQLKAGKASPKYPMAPATTNSNASWFGQITDRCISLPTRLVIAETISGLCRRIVKINTGETSLLLEPGEKQSLRLHRRLWMEGKPESLTLPIDDSTHPFSHELQRHLDAYVPALRKFIIDALVQNLGETAVLVGADSSISAAPEKERINIEQRQQGSQENPPTRDTTVESNQTKLGTEKPAQKSDGMFVQIEINEKMVVKVNGYRIPNTGPANACRALAVLAADGKTASITTSEFVSLSYKTKRGVAKRWNKNKGWLKELGVMAIMVSHGDWHLSGFEISLTPPTDKQNIKAYLERQSPRVRPQKTSDS